MAAAAGAVGLLGASLWANRVELRRDYWRARLERSGAPAAAEALLKLGAPGEEALVEVLLSGDSGRARASAAGALSGARAAPSVVGTLEAAGDDPSDEVRRSAAWALSALGVGADGDQERRSGGEGAEAAPGEGGGDE